MHDGASSSGQTEQLANEFFIENKYHYLQKICIMFLFIIETSIYKFHL